MKYRFAGYLTPKLLAIRIIPTCRTYSMCNCWH